MPDRLTPSDIEGRKILGAVHIDYTRNSSAWLGHVEGVERLSVARGTEAGKPFRHWYIDMKPVRDLAAALAVINGEMSLEAAMQPEPKPARKISLNQQIEEVARELEMRRQVYPRQVKSRAMRESVAEFQIERMTAVLATLEWLRANETEVRAYVAAKAAARPDAPSSSGEAA